MNMEEKIKCVYYIRDVRNNKIIYIGKTINFENRKKCHFSDKRNSIDKYMFEEGRENFEILPFDDIDYINTSDDELLKKENELILYYDTINKGFNKRRSGNIFKDNPREYYKEYYKVYNKELYRNNSDYRKRRSEYHKEYYQKNKEILNTKNREYRRKMKEK